MEIIEQKELTYIFSEEEEINHRMILYKTFKFLRKAGYKTFHLSSDEFEHLKFYCENRFEEFSKEEEVIVVAEKSTVINETPEIYEERKSKRGNKKSIK